MSDNLRNLLQKRREKLESSMRGSEPIYGVNTGFGDLKTKVIPKEKLRDLQLNLIRSHSIGVGEPAPLDVVRLAALLRAISLSRGFSGVRPTVVEKLLEIYNKAIPVFVPLEGSVGASGDLAPLAHLSLFLIGEGKTVDGFDAGRYNFESITLKEKEGLALINGTSFSLSLLIYNYIKLLNILDKTVLTIGLAFNALQGNTRALEPLINETSKKHPGQAVIAKKLRELLKGSELVIDPRKGKSGIYQDSYTLRCVPQILGPTIETLEFVKKIIEKEINSASDNPLFDERREPYSGGNFHAMYLALASDYLKIAAASIGNLAERLLFKMLDSNLNKGLPPFLTKNPGLNSGLMILQYTAASLLAEIKTLANPSSIHTHPTSANQEDIVSMSVPSLISLLQIVNKLEHIISALTLASTIGIILRVENKQVNIGSDMLAEFFTTCKSKITRKIYEKDDIYYDILYRIRSELFPKQISEIELKIFEL